MAASTWPPIACVCCCGMRTAIRRRDLLRRPQPALRRPAHGLAGWAGMGGGRPAICRTLGLSTDRRARSSPGSATSSTPLSGGRRRTCRSTRDAAAGGDGHRSWCSPRSTSWTSRRAWSRSGLRSQARIPRVDLPELLLEMHARTGFADGFTHASEGGPRAAGTGHQLLRRAAGRSLQHRLRAADPARTCRRCAARG